MTTTSLQEEIVVQENRSRLNNIFVDGVVEHDSEMWQDCEKKIKGVLKNNLQLKENIGHLLKTIFLNRGLNVTTAQF